MSNSCGNFYIPVSFNAVNDITWSFQYALTGSTNSTGGFTTFLFNSDTLSGGGALSGLGYSGYGAMSGINDAVLVIGFDSTGLFGVSGSSLSSGSVTKIPNSLTIRTGTNFEYLTCISLTSLGIPLLSSVFDLNTLRFNLTNVGQTLKIAIKDSNYKYQTVLSIQTGLVLSETDQYNIGFSYATPVSGTDKTTLVIKDIHYHGKTTDLTREIGDRSNDVETNYILQSPLSGKIMISPSTTDFLLRS